MTLRKKTFLIIVMTLTGLIVALFLLARFVILQNIVHSETLEMQGDIQSARKTLQANIDELDRLVNDWAAWDDTYEFMSDRNPEYQSSNIQPTTFENLNLNLILYLGASGDVVLASAYDLELGKETRFPEALLAEISSRPSSWTVSDQESSLSGVIRLPEGPLLFAARPILTSTEEGPPRGLLLFGRYLASDEVSAVSDLSNLSIKFWPYDASSLPAEAQEAAAAITDQESTYVRLSDPEKITGFGLINDIYANPALLVQVDSQREVYRLGQTSLLYLFLVLVGLGACSVLVVMLLLERLVLSRLATLSRQVVFIGSSGDSTQQVRVKGTDELAHLAAQINETFAKLSQFQEELQESETRFRQLVEDAPLLIYSTVFGDNGSNLIQSLNPAFQQLTGWNPDEWLGKPFAEIIHPDDRALAGEISAQIASGTHPAPYELRLLTRENHYSICEFVSSPYALHGIVVGELGIGRDITERKEVEDALHRKVAEQAVLHALAMAGAEATSEDDLIERATELIGERLYLHEFGVLLVRDGQLVTHPSYRGVTEESKRYTIPVGKGVTGKVAVTGQPLRVYPVGDFPDYISLANAGIQSELCVPLKLGEQVIGVINTETQRKDAFNEADENLLATLAGQLATAIARLRNESAVREQARQLSALYDVGKEIVGASLDLDRVCVAIHQAVAKLIPAEAFVISLLDEVQQNIFALYLIDHGGRYPPMRTSIDEGLSGKVIADGVSLLVDDIEAGDLGANSRTHFGTSDEVRSIVAVPLRLRGKVMGMLSTQCYRSHAYTESDLHLLELLAAYAAVALANAQLYDETRLQALTFENMFDAVILTDEDGLIIDWNLSACRMFGYTKAEAIGKSPSITHHPDDFPQLQREITRSVKEDGRWSGEVRFVHKDGSQGISDVVVVPMRDDQGKLVATVGVNRDITVRKQREYELEGVSRMSTALRSAKTPEEMCPIVLSQVIDLLRATAGMLVLYDEFRQRLVIACVQGEWAGFSQLEMPEENCLSWQVLDSGRSFSTDSILGVPNFACIDLLEHDYAVAIVPLVTQNNRIGLMLVGRDEPFTPQELRLSEAAADIAANAIHRSRLFEQTRRNAEQMAMVSQVGRDLAETHELSEIYARLAQAVRQLISDFDTLFVSLYDPEREVITCAYGLHEGNLVNVSELPPLKLEELGIGTQSEVIRTRRALVINDLESRLSKVKKLVQVGSPGGFVQSGLYVPLVTKGEILGVLQVQSYQAGRFKPEDAELLTLIGNTAAIAIENTRLFSETERRLRRLAALRTMDIAISSSFDLRVTLSVLLDQITAQLGVDAAAVLLFNPYTQTLDYAAGRGFRSNAISSARVRLGEDLPGKAALEHRLVSSISYPDRFSSTGRLAGEDFAAYFGAPLIAKGQIKGVLEIFNRAPLNPDHEWVDFLETLAGDTAIAIDSASLFSDLQRSNTELILAYDTTLEGWSRALELRDRETEGHAQRVAELTIRLAKAMGVQEMDLVHIRRGALLHDIGKVGVPDSILLKAGQLTEEEMQVMRQHPVFAYEMLSRVSYLRPALDIPRYHHERWDGAGYPYHLSNTQIPLAARIFAVVDVWDALRSERPYRPPWTDQKAMEYICGQSGAHFDPDVVQVFVKLIREELEENSV